MHKNKASVNVYFGPTGGYESRLEHLNHMIRVDEAESKQFPQDFGVNFRQPLASVTNDFLTVASGTRLQTRRDIEEKRIVAENQSLVRRLEKYDTPETRARHHVVLATPHDNSNFFTYQGSNAPARQAEGDRITKENFELAQRIIAIKPSVNKQKMAKQVADHDRLVKQISKFKQGKFVAMTASLKAMRADDPRRRQHTEMLDGEPYQPPQLYKCSPEEASGCAIGKVDYSFSPRAYPLPETRLIGSEAGSGGSSPTAATPRSPRQLPPVNNGGAGSKSGKYIAFSDLQPIPQPPASASRALHNNNVVGNGKQAWQTPSKDDIRKVNLQTDAGVRRAQPTQEEVADRHRIVANQAFYRRGEGSVTLLGLYKSNNERMAALASLAGSMSGSCASVPSSPATSPRNTNNQQSPRVVGPKLGFPTKGIPRPKEDDHSNSDPSDTLNGPTRTISEQNAIYRSETRAKGSPRRNHQTSKKRNVLRDAEEELHYTSKSIYAHKNDADPEPPELTFNSNDYGHPKVCSKGCYRSYGKQLREWRTKAKVVEEERRKDHEQFSIANQLAIAKMRRQMEREGEEDGGYAYHNPHHGGAYNTDQHNGGMQNQQQMLQQPPGMAIIVSGGGEAEVGGGCSPTSFIPRPPQHR